MEDVFKHTPFGHVQVFTCRLTAPLTVEAVTWLNEHTTFNEATNGFSPGFVSPDNSVEIAYGIDKIFVYFRDRNDLAMLFKLRWV